MSEPRRIPPLAIVATPEPAPVTCAACAELKKELRAIKRENRVALDLIDRLTRAVQRESHHIETGSRSVNDGKRHVRLQKDDE